MTDSLRMFLHLTILKPVYPVSMTLDGFTNVANTTSPQKDRVIVWASHFHEAMSEYTRNSLWVFQFENIKSKFKEYYSQWVTVQARYQEALDCYSTTVYHSLPNSVDCLCLTQALDAYHGARYLSHDKRGFQKKIEELCEANKDSLSGLIDDIPIFAKKAVNSRNYYTHHNPEDIKKGDVALAIPDLVMLNAKLKMLFQMSILREIGIPSDRYTALRRQIPREIIE